MIKKTDLNTGLIKKLISKNAIVKALDELDDYAMQNGLDKTHRIIIQLKRRQEDARQSEMKGTISAQDLALEKAKINDAVLDLLDNIERGETPLLPVKGNKGKFIGFSIVGLLLVGLLGWIVFNQDNGDVLSKGKPDEISDEQDPSAVNENPVAGNLKTPFEIVQEDYLKKELYLREKSKAGTLDSSFAEKGYTLKDFGGPDNRWAQASSVIVQSNGKILVAGRTGLEDGNFGFALMRFHKNGTLDTGFGDKGKKKFTFSEKPDCDLVLSNLVQLESGGYLLVGYCREGKGTEQRSQIVLARFTPKGKLDPDFNGTGKLMLPNNESEKVEDVAVQPDGKLILSGSSLKNSRHSLLLIRLLEDGTLDESFGNSGRQTIKGYSFNIEGTGICVVPEGRIYASATLYGEGSEKGDNQFLVACFDKRGNASKDFGGTGFVTINFGKQDDRAEDIALQSDGKIVVGGFKTSDNKNSRYFACARLNPDDGSLDKSFSNDGKIFINTKNVDRVANVVNKIKIQPDGKILLAGQSADTNPDSTNHNSIIRLNNDGKLDKTFGNEGTHVLYINGYSSIYDLAFQEDGKVIAVGVNSFYTGYDFFVGRYHSGLPLGQYKLAEKEQWIWPAEANYDLEFSLKKSAEVSLNILKENESKEVVLLKKTNQKSGDHKVGIPKDLEKGKYTLTFGLDSLQFPVSVMIN